MLLIILHNSQDYLMTLHGLIKKERIVETSFINREKLGCFMPGEQYAPRSKNKKILKNYDKALLAITNDEGKIIRIKRLMDDHPSLRWLNFADSGFICTVPWKRFEGLNKNLLNMEKGETKMKLKKYVTKDQMLLDLNSRTKEDAIKEMAELLRKSPAITNFDQFLLDVFARENLQTTGIGHGVAIPHARTNATEDFILAFGRSQAGIDFGSVDKTPVKLIFLMGTPKKEGLTDYLKILAQLSRLLKRPEFRESLLAAQDPEEILAELTRSDE
ncbi:MAG: PTS sugar transporter subunit IIA [Candidatus Omnitrophica bacterium]|nr:PTS sugar transporter subunit IIA [Candidatus Omnitrophota bacterium]MBU1127696.1 PTS sugar transporter subunit IIA [Candidatus Omnitrophota bacterium]MBU1784235.1 PTS sugar transporter subunit IIA [Candidatus Omnitrophota bacterium]MBU1851928.1 PTS sugar transporter subunit IIA [Candidatus Omnitrophota bacterium]